jgi:hypothetical protein
MHPATPQPKQNNRARPELSHPIFGLMKRVRSAAQTGRGLHLDAEHVRVLLSEEVYGVISAIEAKEIRAACEAATVNDNDINSASSGYGNGRTAGAGSSATATIIPMDAASRGATMLLQQEAALMRRRKRH